MNKFKKGLSLLAVIAFLITALVPIGAMAAAPPQVEGGIPTVPSAPTQVIGSYGTADPEVVPDAGFTATGEAPTVFNNPVPVNTVYVWKGSRVQVPQNAPAGTVWYQVDSNATPDANTGQISGLAIANPAPGTIDTSSSSTGLGSAAAPANAFSENGQFNKDMNFYLVGEYATPGGSGNVSRVVYQLIPVQATVQVVSAPSSPSEVQWGNVQNNLTARWTVVRYQTGSDTGIVQAPPGGVLSCYTYRLDAAGNMTEAPLNQMECANGYIPKSDTNAPLNVPVYTTNESLPVYAQQNYEYVFYGSSTFQSGPWAQTGLNPNGSSAGPVLNTTTTDATGQPTTSQTWPPQPCVPIWNAAPATADKYACAAWKQEQLNLRPVCAIIDGQVRNDVPVAQQTQWTVPATMGADTVLQAELPANSYGVWWIFYNDKQNPVAILSDWNTQLVDLTHLTNPGYNYWNGAAKVTDVPASGLGSMGTSTLQIVVPKPAGGSSSVLQNDITVSYAAMTYGQVGSEQLFQRNQADLPQYWPATNQQLTAWNNAAQVSTWVQFGLIPALESPDVGSVTVSPTTRIIAKDENTTFDIELSPPGGLVIDRVSVIASSPDAFLGSTALPFQTRPIQITPPADPATSQTWTANTKDLPVGNYELKFDVAVKNPNNAQYVYTLHGTANVQVMEFQGKILNSSETTWNTWRTRTGQLSAAPNQVLELSAAWLDKVTPMVGAPHVDAIGNPTAAGYTWTVVDSTGANVPSAPQYLQQSGTKGVLTMPSGPVTGSPMPWTISCQPVNAAGGAVGTPVTYVINMVTASPQPVVSGYYYDVTPATSVFPTSGTLASFQVSGAAGGRNIPVAETGSAAAMAGATVRISPVLSLQNDPAAMDYQWMVLSGAGWTELVEGPEVSGVTSRVLTISASVNTKGWELYCKVTNKANDALTAGSDNQFVDLQVRTPGAVDTSARPLPMITSNPSTGTNPVQNPSNVTTVTVSSGVTVTFTAQDMNSTDGAPAPLPNDILHFQWMCSKSQNGPFEPIEGATDPTYFVTATQENSGTYYQVHVINTLSQGQKTGDSNKIRMTVLPPSGAVWFTAPETTPDPQNVRPGATVTMSVSAKSDNDDAIRYQWQVARVSKNTTIDEVMPGAWTDVSGATSDTLTTAPLTNGYYFYRCIASNATNAGKNATSLPFRVNVTALNNVPSVSPSHLLSNGHVNTIPVGVEEGSSVTFGVTAGVDTAVLGDTLVYTWKAVAPQVTGTGANQVVTFQDPTSAANTIILAAGTNGELVLDAPLSYNGYSFVCQVSNANDPNAYAYSGVWNLTVWPEGTVPTIVAEPKDITATYIDAYSTVDLEDRQTAVSLALPMPNDTTEQAVNGQANPFYPGRGTSVVLQKLSGGQWQNVTATAPMMSNGMPIQSVMQLVTATPAQGVYNTDKTTVTYTAQAVLGKDAYLANGTYRIAVTGYAPKGTEWAAPVGLSGGYPTPTAFTDPFEVNITVVGQPVITQQPVSKSVEVGQQATFEIKATVEPATTVLTYRWQKSTDNQTWLNCLDSDGTGAGTPTFTTVPTTVDMQKSSPIYYRCVVQNLATQQTATSSTAALGIVDATAAAAPSIAVAEGTALTITEKDGVKYLCGEALEATKDGTTVAQLKDMIAAPAAGYTLQVTASDGAAKEDDAIVGTDDLLKLVNAAGEAADQATIVVRGDVLGTGTMSLTQLVRMAEAYRPSDPNALEGAFFMAGDLTGTGTIDLTDLVQEAGIYKTEIMAAE